MVAFIDITEKKKIEEELIKLNKLKSELLTRSSHELKTPLMSIKGFTELLLLKYNEVLNDEEAFLINEIKKGCTRLETLIKDILKSADLESGSIIIEKSENDLSRLIKTCVNDLKGLADLRNHTINLILHDRLITQFENKQIRQAFNNLLSNAIKYTPPYGKIDVKSQIGDKFITISIKDSGIGLTEEEIEQLFKHFGKIERFGQGFDVITEGSGLGLYISKKLIELHGGNVWVESEGRNKGSTFYFSLPTPSN
jgi:signal transduction histidine kinase